MTDRNQATILLEEHLKELGLRYEREYQFHPDRKWRSDFCIRPHWILVEIEGAVWTSGRHTRGSGFIKDLEKYNTCSVLGYRLLRFSTADVLTGYAKTFLEKWLCGGSTGQEKVPRERRSGVSTHNRRGKIPESGS